MTADEILEEWTRDSEIDRVALDQSLLDIAGHWKKYAKYLHSERAELRKLEARHLQLTQLKTEWYQGKLNGTDELKELGWEPYRGLMLKEDLSRKVATDKSVMKLTELIGEQKEKISILMGILDRIKSLSFDIRGAMEWQKFLSGA